MKKSKKLKLGKSKITELNLSKSAQIKGGGTGLEESFSDGCTDGCSPAMTYWNCTKFQCTNDCDTRTTTGGLLC